MEEKGEAGQQASSLVANQAVEFPQVLASNYDWLASTCENSTALLFSYYKQEACCPPPSSSNTSAEQL